MFSLFSLAYALVSRRVVEPRFLVLFSVKLIPGIFTSSRCVSAGAILLYGGSEVFINGSTDFFNNHARDDGGKLSNHLPRGTEPE